jgi:hypothetical protein
VPCINIQLPTLEADQSIEIEVKINEKKQKHNYRVEIFSWSECPVPENRVDCLKEIIANYDQQWQIIQIGSPTEKDIPLMFKQITN